MFRGSLPALVTPFTPDGELDLPALEKLVEWHVDQGSHGLVPVGTTGESPTLSHEEHRKVIEEVVRMAAGRIPVIAGAGSNSTREGIGLVQHAQAAGADAALVVTPYYNKPTQAGLVAHYTALHDASDLPIIIYNIPGRSVIDMAPETMGELARLPRIIGVKDATGKLERVSFQCVVMFDDGNRCGLQEAKQLNGFACRDLLPGRKAAQDIRCLDAHQRGCGKIGVAQAYCGVAAFFLDEPLERHRGIDNEPGDSRLHGSSRSRSARSSRVVPVPPSRNRTRRCAT